MSKVTFALCWGKTIKLIGKSYLESLITQVEELSYFSVVTPKLQATKKYQKWLYIKLKIFASKENYQQGSSTTNAIGEVIL